MKTQLHVSSALLENHNRLQVLCAKHDKYDKLADNMETQEQIDILKMKEELNYYKVGTYSNKTFFFSIFCSYFILFLVEKL